MPRSKVGKALTKVRGPVHGNFAEGATITQGVIALLSSGSSWPKMSPAKREALHMIVHKMHRIVTGNPDHKDHWDDIGGYGQLGANDCLEAAPVKRKYRKRQPVPVKGARKAKAEPAARAPRKVARRPVAVKKKVTARPARVAARKKTELRPAARVARRGRPVLNGAAGHQAEA